METTQPPPPKFCIKRCCSKTMLGFTSVVLILLIVVLLLVIWVATGPRSLQQFTPQITEEINSQLDGYRIELDDIQLAWDSWRSPLDMQFKQVRLYSKNNMILANLEQVAVSANTWALFVGDVVLDRITIYKPTINVYRKLDGSYSLDLGYDTSYGPELPPDMRPEQAVKPLGEYLRDADIPKLLGLTEFNIRGGTVNVGSTRRGLLARFHSVNFVSAIDRDGVDIGMSAKLKEGKQHAGSIQASIEIPMDSLAAEGWLKFRDIQPALVSRIEPQLEILRGAKLPVSGSIELALNQNGAMQHGSFQLTGGRGVLSHNHLEKDIAIQVARFKGYVPSEHIVVIEKGELKTDVTHFIGQAKLSYSEEQVGISADIQSSGLPAENIKEYWPVGISPVSREWVTTNLSKGRIAEARLKLDIQPDMHALPRFPDEAVDTTLRFDGLDVRFLPEFDKVHHASGVVNINANELIVDISEAAFFAATKLSNGKVTIDDLNADNPNIGVSLDIQAPAKEVAKLLSNPLLEIAQEVNMSEEVIDGQVAGKVKLLFPYILPRDTEGKLRRDGYNYQVDAALQNMLLPQFLEQYDLSHVNGKLKVDNKKVVFNGKADVFETPLTLGVDHQLYATQGVQTKLDVSGSVDDPFLRRFGVDTLPYVAGDMVMDTKVNVAVDDSISVQATGDLTQAKVEVAELGWVKPVTVPATVKLVAEENVVGTNLSSVEFYSGSNLFEGSLALDADGALQQITATKLTLGDNNLKLSFAPIVGGYKIYAQGDYFDASRFLEEDEDEPFSFEDIPALDVMVDLKKIILDDERYVENLNGKVDCGPKICEHIELSGNMQGAKPVVISVKRQGRERQMKVSSEDAGSLLKGLNIYENMEGGRILVDGVYNDRDAAHPLTGRLHIWDFELQDTPILARIITLASFTGVLDALSGQGLGFDKLKSKFVLRKDVISVSELKARGSSLGITADGEVNLAQDTLALKGTVIPAYTLNSLLKDVPLVGEILTGGEGIIAATYTVKGPTDEADVSVNPLSALAPGFLRGIFE